MLTRTAQYFVFALLCLGFQNARGGEVEHPLVSSEISQEIQSRINAGLYVGFVIGILDSEGEHYFSYGRKSFEYPGPPDKDTVFTIGSISKTFAATVVATLVERDEISYKKSIQEYLPDSVQVPVLGGDEITVWNLITHTSGLADKPPGVSDVDLWDGYRNYHRQQAYSALGASQLLFEPGSDIAYSSFGVGLLVDILAIQSGKSWESLLNEIITDELSMTRTSSEFTPDLKENLAQGYCYLTPTSADVRMIINENGSVKSTAKDMLQYLRANMGLVESSVVPAMQSTHVVQFEPGPIPGSTQGLGWWIRGDYHLHTGMTDGYRSFAAFNNKEKRAVIVLSNSTTWVQDIAMKLIEPDFELWEPKEALSIALYKEIQISGMEKALYTFRALSETDREKYWVNLEGLIDNAVYFVRNGKAETGIGILQLADDYSPNNPDIHFTLGYAYEQINDGEKSKYHYAKSDEYQGI